MSTAQFTIPLITVIPGQLITAVLWNNEYGNLFSNLNPLGIGGYSDTDAQMQIQTAPYPGAVTSHATSVAGEIERIRYQISQILGATSPAFWYAAPPSNLLALSNIVIPIGGYLEMAAGGVPPPAANFHLADGTAISRTVYSTLFTAIGIIYGAGDGSTTFNLPNFYDRVSIGAGNLYSIGSLGGAASHTLTVGEIPSGLTVTDPGHNHTQNAHNHGVTDPGHTHVEKGTVNLTGSSNQMLRTAAGDGTDVNSGSSTASATTGVTTNNTTATNNSATTGITVGGGGGSHSLLNPYVATLKYIRIL